MNYSVFKLQNQGGKPSIFWEKETVPKKDRKFGYKQRNQRFPVRRYAEDRHHIDTDLVSLPPDEPQPPPKPAKNFIQRNKNKVTKKPESTVTLTQEQLNAILRSVGKVASGSENAVKISIDQKDKMHSEVLVESPRRHDDDDEYDDHRERRRKKKSPEKKHEDNSIYSFLDGKSKGKSTSDNQSELSEGSVEQTRDTKKSRRRRDRKSRRTDEEYDDDYDEEPIRDRNRRNKSKRNVDIDNDDNAYDSRTRKHRSKNRQDELDDEISGLRHRIRLEGEDSDTEVREVRRRRNRSKPRDSDDDEGVDIDRSKSDRHRKDEGSKERQTKARRESEERDANESLTKKDDELIPSPRDKIGLPNDLSWRHMTKAERRRLEIARQKFVEDDEKKEDERIHQLNAKYAPDSIINLKPQKHKGPRSDPSTRVARADIGRNTDLSNYTDNNRRGRHSRTPSPDMNEPSHSSPVDTSPKAPMGIPRRHMTLAEKKRLEWERDRVESVALQQHSGNYDPWGKPGAGAPLRTKSGHVVADYKGRQEQMHNQSQNATQQESSVPSPRVEDKGTSRKAAGHRPRSPAAPAPAAPTQQSSSHQADVPHAMRSSFVLGQAAPDINHLESAKERERKKWLAELEQQIEEKRQKNLNGRPRAEDETWANKFGQSHRAIPFLEQTRDPGAGGADLNTSADQGGGLLPLESYRDVSSAPDPGQETSHLRGQNVPMDPATKREQEEKRRRYLEHQGAVKAQVEEKERLKRLEREHKMKEDMEEERKMQAERDALKNQFEMEQQKVKQKEQQRQAQVNQLKAAMDEAQAKALQEKYQRKMQHLEAGGHDTKKLREHLEALELNLILDSRATPRDHDDMVVVEPSHIPGLDFHTSRQSGYQTTNRRNSSMRHEPYQEDRVLTPSRLRRLSKPWSDPSSPRREFGTQTVDDISRLINPTLNRDYSEVDIQYKFEKGKKVRVVSAPKEAVEKRGHKSREPTREPRPPPSHSGSTSPHDHHHEVRERREEKEIMRKKKLEEKLRKGPVRPGSRPKWGYKNPAAKKPQKQSEKDPFYEQKKKESEERRVKREQQLLALVDANKDIIPDYYVPDSQRISRSRSRSKSPFSDIEMASPREVKLNRRARSLTPESQRHHGDSYHAHMGAHNEGWNHHRSTSPQDNDLRHMPSHDHGDRPSRSRVKSPPVPAIRRKTDTNQNADNAKRGGKYDDADPLNKPVQNGDFVPFTRTIDVLDPSKAEEPLALSREATKVANARRKYYESLHPNQFGNRQYPLKDEHRPLPGNPNDPKNPIINPGLVLDRPTNRQDQILVQLSTLKQSLMQRQRELETFSPTDLMRYNTDIKA